MAYGGVLIKPVSGRCQMDCRYCFYREEQAEREVGDRGVMSPDLLEQVIRAALADSGPVCTFAFQGGEPTLAGLPFFREVVRLQRQYARPGVVVANAIQTNGLAVDDDWSAFFAEHHFLVGLSLDGDRLTHDRNRLDRTGQGTYDRASRAARRLRRHGAAVNILCVVTEELARRGAEVYRALRQEGFDWLQFIPCLAAPGRPAEKEKRPALSAEAYGDFLLSVFAAWEADLLRGERVSVRTFDNWLLMLQGQPPEACGMSGECAITPTIEADGSVYPCDFYALDAWRLGRIGEQPLADMVSGPVARRFLRTARTVDPECQACVWYMLCRGGCRRDREDPPGTGSLERNRLCLAYRRFFSSVYPRLERLAAMPREP